ncbi:MAG: hypothetical protein NTX50_13165, partial [Candidatus Sumerlaeota bacterium]|nr:hypothetical protein [Candidatus Sumerlaeota bacterium]
KRCARKKQGAISGNFKGKTQGRLAEKYKTMGWPDESDWPDASDWSDASDKKRRALPGYCKKNRRRHQRLRLRTWLSLGMTF